MDDLRNSRCVDLPAGTPAMAPADVEAAIGQLHPDWRVDEGKLVRRFEVKGFAPALLLANAAGFLAEREGHHPDIGLGWGWCEVVFWTHTVGGLSPNDFICAAKLDQIVSG